MVPIRPAKPVRQSPASPPGLQSRLHSQAGKLIGHPEEAQDQDLLVLSDDDSEQGGPQRDAVLADASLSLVGVCLHHHAELGLSIYNAVLLESSRACVAQFARECVAPVTCHVSLGTRL